MRKKRATRPSDSVRERKGEDARDAGTTALLFTVPFTAFAVG